MRLLGSAPRPLPRPTTDGTGAGSVKTPRSFSADHYHVCRNRVHRSSFCFWREFSGSMSRTAGRWGMKGAFPRWQIGPRHCAAGCGFRAARASISTGARKAGAMSAKAPLARSARLEQDCCAPGFINGVGLVDSDPAHAGSRTPDEQGCDDLRC